MRDPKQVFQRYGRQLLVPGLAFHGQAALHGWAGVCAHDASDLGREAALVAARYLVGAGLGRVALPQSASARLADLDPAVEIIGGPEEAAPPVAQFHFAARPFGATVDVVLVEAATLAAPRTRACTLRWTVGRPASVADAVALGTAAAGLLLDDVFELDPLPAALAWDWTDPVAPKLVRTARPAAPALVVTEDPALLQEILGHAAVVMALTEASLAQRPAEACGLLVRDGAGQLHATAADNLQDACHAADPARFPRTSRTGWQLDVRVIARERALGRELVALWHSHVDTGAHFSAEDVTGAAPDGQLLYPGVAHVVVALHGAEVSEIKAYRLEIG